LRTEVMGERAFEAQANEEEIERIEREVHSAIRAGAFGFTTSRSPSHLTTDDRPVASRLASCSEVKRLVSAMTAAGGYIFELPNEPAGSTGQGDQATSVIPASAVWPFETLAAAPAGLLRRRRR
jgi:N-acyl-D-aspartate/D-glutamate deacylase